MQIISLKTQGRKTLQIAARISASLLVLALGFPASASGPDQTATTLRPVKRFKRWMQVGQASWYGWKFQGRKTATGESFDPNQLTCAHSEAGSALPTSGTGNRSSFA
jgi:rare lipoprotein A